MSLPQSFGARIAYVLAGLLMLFVVAAGAPADARPAAPATAAKAKKAHVKKHKRAVCAAKRRAGKRCDARRLRAARPRKPKPIATATPTATPSPTATPVPTTSPAPTPTATTSPAPPGTAYSGQDMFGIAAGGNIQNLDAATQARDLDALQAAGARWLRIDINWNSIQYDGPNSYNWGPIDRVVNAARARGMKVFGTILFTPPWARPAGAPGTYGPDPATFAKFAGEAVAHYAPMGVHHYEVWNEANIPNFWATPNVAAYTALLKAAYPAIKAADPTAVVLTAGTAPAPTSGSTISPVDFLKGIYANGGKGYFDAVAHHPYCAPAFAGDAQNWSAWYQMYGTSPSLRSVMSDNGDAAKKIWATEYGAPTGGPAGDNGIVSESTQAAMVTRAYTLWKSYPWAGPMMWYSGRDAGTSSTDREHHYGFMRYDFSPKPAFDAYRTAATG